MTDFTLKITGFASAGAAGSGCGGWMVWYLKSQSKCQIFPLKICCLHSFCISNGKFRGKMAFILQFAARHKQPVLT